MVYVPTLHKPFMTLTPAYSVSPVVVSSRVTVLKTRYQWKNSVGPVENRPLNENRWNYTFKHKAFPDYFQTLGLGYFEYFLLSEDLGAEPLPVISCGLSCQYESNEVVRWMN